jgi:hypothetical protein
MSSYRIQLVLNGNRDAIVRSVRRMLDNHGFTEVGFEMHAEIFDPLGFPVVDPENVAPDESRCHAWRYPGHESWDGRLSLLDGLRCALASGHPGPHSLPGHDDNCDRQTDPAFPCNCSRAGLGPG